MHAHAQKNLSPNSKKNKTNIRGTTFPGNLVKTASKNIVRLLRSIHFCIFGLGKMRFRDNRKKARKIGFFSLKSTIFDLAHPNFTITCKIIVLIIKSNNEVILVKIWPFGAQNSKNHVSRHASERTFSALDGLFFVRFGSKFFSELRETYRFGWYPWIHILSIFF